MTLENPNESESPPEENESNNHANAIARQLRMASEETLEEIGADERDDFTRASELRDEEEEEEDSE